MNDFLTNESPVKVMCLLATALSSMFFLFAVTVSNPGLGGVKAENPFPDPFASANVVRVMDVASNNYSKFLDAYLFQPAQDQVAFLADDASYIASNAGPQISQDLGLNRLASTQGMVAGASTEVVVSQYYPASGQSLNVNTFFKYLTQ